jgi:RNA polymerase sigma-70 factor (ECF subfamily)
MTTAQAEPLTRYLHQVTAAHLAADLPDPQLLERYAGRRDEAAFTALVRRHGPLVLGACRRVLGDAHAAEDVFQATFLLLARKAGSLRRPAALGPWLHGVATRIALKARGREARRRAVEGQAAALAATAASAEDPVWRDLRPLLDEAVGGLPVKLRVPFVLHYLEGRTVTAVARQLGCPRGTVATHLARARQQLRTRLTRRGVTLSAAAVGVALSRQLAVGALAPALPGVLVKTAAGFAAGQAAAGTVPAGVVVLAQGGLPTMSLKKQIVVAVLLLGLGAAGGGTVLLAQGTGTKERPVRQTGAAPTPAAAETDLVLFREGAKRFRAEDYRGADRCFSRLLERFPASPLASQAAELAITAKDMSTTKEDASFPLERVREGRRIIDAVLAGASAAEAGQGKKHSTSADGTKQKVKELMQEFHELYKEGKFKEAEMYASAAFELDPDNATVGAAVKIAHIQRGHAEYLEKALREEPEPDLPRKARQSDNSSTFTPDLSRPITGPKKEDKEKQIEKQLQLRMGFGTTGDTVEHLLDSFRTSYGLNIVIDRPALNAAGVSLKHPVSLHLDCVNLKTVLTAILAQVELTYTVRDGIIVVTTPDAAAGKPVRQVYPVAGLVGRDPNAETLIRLITRSIKPASWDMMGGSGTIDYYPLGQALVVSQTPDVQEQIADFLAMLRRLRKVEEK